jgi:hypothetical protein
MMRRLLPILGVLALAPSLALAQTPQKKTPGPEHERLGYFVGKWNGRAEVKQNPFMPEGTYTSTGSCEWFEGRFTVVCRGEGRSPMGTTKDPASSAGPEGRTYYGLDSSGMTMAASQRTMKDGTWVFTDESGWGGKRRLATRCVRIPTRTFKMELKERGAGRRSGGGRRR